jgi:hypothetical protein
VDVPPSRSRRLHAFRKMVHMANQIALSFEGCPKEETVAGVADGLKNF